MVDFHEAFFIGPRFDEPPMLFPEHGRPIVLTGERFVAPKGREGELAGWGWLAERHGQPAPLADFAGVRAFAPDPAVVGP